MIPGRDQADLGCCAWQYAKFGYGFGIRLDVCSCAIELHNQKMIETRGLKTKLHATRSAEHLE